MRAIKFFKKFLPVITFKILNSEVFLALGSNIEPRKNYILQALNLLQDDFRKLKISSLYETQPYAVSSQENYYNCVLSFTTEKNVWEVFKINQEIEKKLGRESLRKKGQARTIDVDLLFFGKEIIKTESLTIPHYDFLNRDFFIIPLLEIKPEFQYFPNITNLQELLKKIPENKKTYPKKIVTLY